jgi:hypothetical protein
VLKQGIQEAHNDFIKDGAGNNGFSALDSRSLLWHKPPSIV